MHTTASRLAKSGSSARWLARQRADPYANTSSHYVSRAAPKLEQIDSRFRLFPYSSSSSSRKQSTECNVVDLGAAPGSWTQYIHSRLSKLPQSRLVAVDLLDLDELRIPATTFIQGDFTQAATQSRILEALGGQQADVVVSDMLHNTTGNRERDAAVSFELCEAVWHFAAHQLKPGGHLVMKYYNSELARELADLVLKPNFQKLFRHKPQSSRSDSREDYFVCMHKKS